MTRALRAILTFALLTLASVAIAPCALAQPEPITVTARATLTAFVDEDFQLEIIIRGTQQAEKPVIPRSESYDVLGSGFMVSSGSSGAMMAHTYQIRPKKTGELVIPPIEVNVAGKLYKTNEVRVNIYDRPVSELAFSIVPDKARVYVGEPIRLRIALRLARPEFRDPRFTLGGEGDFDLQPHPDQQQQPANGSIGQFAPFADPTSAVLDGREVPLTKSREVVEGVPGDYLIIDQVFTARSPGRVAFDRARAVIGVPGRAVGRDFFGRTQYAVEDRALSAKPVSIEVLPLPSEGQPADFSGLVGAFAVSATADQREVAVGEPFNLSVTVSGSPPISQVPAIDLSLQRELAQSFRVPRDPVLPSAANPTTAVFRSPIRARNDRVQFIPPVRLNYFDTASGTYKTAASNPIALKVKPASSVGLDDDLDEPADSPAAAAPAVMPGPFEFGGPTLTLRGALTHPASAALALAPPAILAGLAVWIALARRAAASEPARRRRRAVRSARREVQRLREGASEDAASTAILAGRALTNLAADWFGLPRHTLTSSEACRLLATASTPAAESLAPVLVECDRLGFGPDADVRGQSLIDRAVAALRDAERNLRGGRR
ncbi:MAG: BatD family protein [Phycisphaerales bacterium]|nr:BatD family protein [Phycisphaerales bacterium]